MICIYFLIYYLFRKKLKVNTECLYNEKANVYSYLEESIKNYESIKNLNIENTIISKYKDKYLKYLNKIVTLDKCVNKEMLFKQFNDSFGQLLIYYIGILLIYNNRLLLSSLIAFNSVSYFFFTPIRNILDMDLSFEEAKSAFKRAYELQCEFTLDEYNCSLDSTINIKKLNYSYDDEHDILKNINLSIGAGDKIG